MIAEPSSAGRASNIPLRTVFNDLHDYAWQLLEWEVAIDLSTTLDGKDIAQLLSLYMRAIERLNSFQDKRQNYFKNRMALLMMRPSVVKTLNSPGKGREEPKSQPSSASKDQQPSAPLQSQSSHTDVQLKRKEMEMKVTYQTSDDELKRILSQHSNKSTTLNNCIENAITENQKRIDDRIRLRKLKSMTAREKSQKVEVETTGEQDIEKKMYVVDIEVIQEEKEEDNPSPNRGQTSPRIQVSKRRHSFDSPTNKEQQDEGAQPRERRKSFFEIHLRLKQV